LVPRGSLDCHVAGTGKGEESAGHEGADYDLIDAHLGFVSASPRTDLDCFFWRVGIVDAHIVHWTSTVCRTGSLSEMGRSSTKARQEGNQ